MEKGGGLRKYKGGCRGIQRKNKYRSKKTREVEYSRIKRLQEGCYNLRLGSGCNLGKDLRKE